MSIEFDKIISGLCVDDRNQLLDTVISHSFNLDCVIYAIKIHTNYEDRPDSIVIARLESFALMADTSWIVDVNRESRKKMELNYEWICNQYVLINTYPPKSLSCP